MAGRGTVVTFVDVEYPLLDRTVSHLPVAADLLPSRAKKESSLQWKLYFALVGSHVFKGSGKNLC